METTVIPARVKPQRSVWWLLLTGAILIALLAVYTRVVPVILLGVGSSTSLSDRLQWWLWPVAFWSMAFMPVLRVNSGDSGWTRVAGGLRLTGLLLISHAAVWAPIILFTSVNGSLAPSIAYHSTRLPWGMSAWHLAFPLAALVVAAALVNVSVIWAILHPRSRVTGLPLFVMLVLTVVIGEVAIRIETAAGIFLAFLAPAVNETVCIRTLNRQ